MKSVSLFIIEQTNKKTIVYLSFVVLTNGEYPLSINLSENCLLSNTFNYIIKVNSIPNITDQ